LIEELKRDFTLLIHEIWCHINVTKEEDGKVKDIHGIGTSRNNYATRYYQIFKESKERKLSKNDTEKN
jgi:hypothetical protein